MKKFNSKEYAKRYRAKNRLRLSAQNKEWRSKNADHCREYKRRYVVKNAADVKDRRRRYWEENKDRLTAYHREYNETRRVRKPETAEQRRRRLAHNKTAAYQFSQYKHRSAARGLAFELSFMDFVSLRDSACYFCGKPGPGGIDRMDNLAGYTKDNSVPCCAIHNIMKRHHSAEDFIEACAAVVRHMGVR